LFRVLFYVSGGFVAEVVDGVGDKGSGDTTTTLGGLFEHVPEICLFQ
jgi:hypothetical protein